MSTHSIKTMIGWHYKLYRQSEGMDKIESLFNTVRNLAFGFYKKKKILLRQIDPYAFREEKNGY